MNLGMPSMTCNRGSKTNGFTRTPFHQIYPNKVGRAILHRTRDQFVSKPRGGHEMQEEALEEEGLAGRSVEAVYGRTYPDSLAEQFVKRNLCSVTGLLCRESMQMTAPSFPNAQLWGPKVCHASHLS